MGEIENIIENHHSEIARLNSANAEKLSGCIENIKKELGKDKISIEKLSEVVSGIENLRNIKDEEIKKRKRWAQGFGHGEKLTSLSLDFTPGVVFIGGENRRLKAEGYSYGTFGKHIYKVDLKNRKRYYLKLIYAGEGSSRSTHILRIERESEDWGDPNITLDGDYFIVE